MVAAHRHHKTFTKPAWRQAQAVLIPLAHAPSCVRCSIQWRATLADESKAMTDTHIGMIGGYGEVGKIFSSGLKHQPGVGSVVAWDCQFAQPDTGPALITGAHCAGIPAMANMQQLCEAATLLASAVTASNTPAVAQEAARHI
jgi:hypothetical protein